MDTQYEDWFDAQEIQEEEAAGRYAADLLIEDKLTNVDVYKQWHESVLKIRDVIVERRNRLDW
ncbi:MAG: hypothetical protein O6846_03965 [Thaumarchaeota archaeon]|nr:hypothetical protein [Nitrososphaerota archaeon]